MRCLLAIIALLLMPQPALALTMGSAPDFVLAKVNGLIKGSIKSGSITYTSANGLVLKGAELLAPDGRLVLSAKRIQLRVDLLDLLRSVVVIKEVSIAGLNAKISENKQGKLNLLEAMALKNPSTDNSPSSGGVRVQKLNITNGRFAMDLAAIKIEVRDLNVNGKLHAVGQFSADLSVSSGKTTMLQPGRGEPLIKLKLAGIRLGHLGIGSHSIRISDGKLRIGASHRLSLRGLLRPAAGRIDMRLGGQLPNGWLKTILPQQAESLPEISGLGLDVHLLGALGNPKVVISARAERVVLPAGAPTLKSLELEATYKANALQLTRIDALGLGGSLSLTGKLSLDERLSISADLRIKKGKLAKVHESLRSYGGRFTGRALLSGALKLSDADPLSIQLRGRLSAMKIPAIGRRTADLDVLILQGESTRLMPSQATIGANLISLQGEVYPQLDLSWRAQLKSARSLLKELGGDSLPKQINARGRLRLKPRMRLDFRVNCKPYDLAGQAIGALSARGYMDDSALHLKSLSGSLEQAPIDAQIVLHYARPKNPVGRFSLKDYPLPGGAGRALIDLSSDPEGRWQGDLIIDGLRAGELKLGTLEFLLRYDGQRAELRAMDWDEGPGILSGVLGVNLQTLRSDGFLNLYLDQTGLSLLGGDMLKGRAQLRIEPKGLLSDAAARIALSFSGLSIGGIPLSDGELTLAATSDSLGGSLNTTGNGVGRGTVRLSEGFKKLDVQLKLTAFRLDSLPIDLPGLEALADIDLRLSGPVGQPQGEAQIRLRDVAVDDRLVGNGKGRIQALIGADSLKADINLLGWVKGEVTANLPQLDKVSSQLRIDAEGLQWVIPGLAGGGTEIDFKANAILGLRDGEPEGSLLVQKLRIGNPGLWEEELENDGELVLGYGGGRARFERLALKMGKGSAELRGWIETGDETARASLHLASSLPLELLQLVDSGFSLTRGRVQVSGSLRGRWKKDARLIAEIEPVPGTAFVHSAFPRQVTFAGGSIRLEDQQVIVDSLRVESGAGQLRLAGNVLLEDFQPSDIDLNLSVTNLLLRFQDQFLEFSSDLRAFGPLDSARISGQLNLLSGKVEQTLNISNFVFSSHQEGAGPSLEETLGRFASTELDLEIVSAASLQIIAGLPLFRIEVRPTLDLRLVGQLSDIGVQGVIEIEEGNGEIIFPEAAFAIDNATVDLSQDPYFVSLNSVWEYVPRRQQNNDQDDVITLELGIEGPVDRMELRLQAPDYPDLTRPQLLGMLARGQTPDLLISQNLGEDGGDGSYSDVALRMLTGQMFKRFESELEKVFRTTFELPLDASIDLGVDTLRMQGVVNISERFEVSGETEVVFGSQDNESAEDNQSAVTTSNDRQSLRGTLVLSDAWRAETDLRSGYRSDEEGSMLELLLNLHWRLWAR
jgi:hypothetical protein